MYFQPNDILRAYFRNEMISAQVFLHRAKNSVFKKFPLDKNNKNYIGGSKWPQNLKSMFVEIL